MAAEDLTSQVFLKALQGLDLQCDPHRTRTWLFHVARTTLADYWRASFRGTASSLDELLEAGWEGPAEEEPELPASRAADRVQDLLQALPQRDREVLTCRFLLHLSVRETALRMGLTEANVKVVQFRALKRAADLEHLAPGPGAGVMTGFPASLPGKRNLSKVRDGGMPLLSVVCVKPGQAEASDVNETHHYRSKKAEKNEDNEQDHRNERQESHPYNTLDIRDVQFYVCGYSYIIL